MKASTKAINYNDIFELNYNYYLVGAKKDATQLDNINYYINPLLGAVMKLRFDNSTGYMKKWLVNERKWLEEHKRPADIIQIVFDYLYGNLKHWTKLQLVIPTVSVPMETISKLKCNHIEWVTNMKEAIINENKEKALELHKQLMDALMECKDLKFNYRIKTDEEGNPIPIDYIHIIAERGKFKRTVNLTRLFRDKSNTWDPVKLIFGAVIEGFKPEEPEAEHKESKVESNGEEETK